MSSNIYLCGFMGAGKNTVGQILAKQRGGQFFDTDELIQEACGITIPQIFARYGEPYFREQETLSLRYTGEFDDAVVATGGGIVMNADNVELIKNVGKLIYLNTSFEVCYERVKNDINRPNAISRTRQQLLELYEIRQQKYFSAADVVIHGGDDPQISVCEILEKI